MTTSESEEYRAVCQQESVALNAGGGQSNHSVYRVRVGPRHGSMDDDRTSEFLGARGDIERVQTEE